MSLPTCSPGMARNGWSVSEPRHGQPGASLAQILRFFDAKKKKKKASFIFAGLYNEGVDQSYVFSNFMYLKITWAPVIMWVSIQ